MYALLRNVMDSLTAPIDPERTRGPQRAATLPSEVNTVDHPPQNEDGQQDSVKDPQSDGVVAADLVDRPSYPTRMRVILILSIISWIIAALAIAWAIGRF